MAPRSRADHADQATLLAAFASAGTTRAGGAPTRRARAGRRGARDAGKGLLHWTPVLVALALFAQVSLLGLRPALRESARLARAEERLVARHEDQLERARQLERVLRAQRDPIYLERERRLLLDPDAGLLSR